MCRSAPQLECGPLARSVSQARGHGGRRRAVESVQPVRRGHGPLRPYLPLVLRPRQRSMVVQG